MATIYEWGGETEPGEDVGLGDDPVRVAFVVDVPTMPPSWALLALVYVAELIRGGLGSVGVDRVVPVRVELDGVEYRA